MRHIQYAGPPRGYQDPDQQKDKDGFFPGEPRIKLRRKDSAGIFKDRADSFIREQGEGIYMIMPELQGSFLPFQDLMMKHSEADILLAAVDLGIFSELDTERTAEEVASRIGLHPGNTRHLLNALASFDLLRVSGGRFLNAPIAGEFLVTGNSTYLGEYLKDTFPWYSLSPDMISRLVREGPSAMETMVEAVDENTWESRAQGSVNYQRAGMVQLVVQLISSLPEYLQFSRMLDLGCGPGLMGIGLVLNHPSMTVVLYDQPPVVTVTRRSIREYGVEDRVSVMSGNYLIDPIGDGYDLILASMTLNYALDDLDALIAKLHAVLNPGGVLVTLSDALREEGTKPESMVISMLKVNLSGTPLGMKEDQIADSMLRAGFAHVRGRQVFSPVGEIDYEIGRKKK